MIDRRRHLVRPRLESAVVGFTLLELLVVVSIIFVLVGLLGTTLGKVRGSAKSFVCKNNMRTASFAFRMFADETTHPDRGDSGTRFGRSFRLEDFQESVYAIDEFWDLGDVIRGTYAGSKQPLMCPSGSQELSKRANLPCRQSAVTPLDNISTSFNMRLDRASVMIGPRPVLQPVTLNGRILEHPSVPLVFDVDGKEASDRGLLPYYSAPAAGDSGKYAADRFWFPSTRHGGEVNVGFIGGHVLSSRDPAKEPGWDWKYQPSP